jgi:hypothetical protein
MQMTADEMIELRMRKPFLPFTIQMRDGSSVHVDQPNALATARNSTGCAVYDADDHIHIVRYRDIVGVTPAQVNGA